MANYLPPLSVIFVWHPLDANSAKPIVEHCFSLLSRDINKPFSRSMNLPIFFRTTNNKGLPNKIDAVSQKTVIFTFVSKEVASDDAWVAYISEIPKTKDMKVIPIALDKKGLELSDIFENINFIRAYAYETEYICEYMFISIAHEIYRYSLNEAFKEKALGNDTALKIFLSHAKDGKSGIKLAEKLKQLIDNSVMQKFFDATDIAPGYKFDEEIIENIKKSTLIAIHSDIYSSRYWCQREILCAKEYDRPIIAIDALEEQEDRRFPFACNVPGIHVNSEADKKDLLRILSLALLETVRFFYVKILLSRYKSIGLIEPEAQICSRPPEVADIQKIFSKDGNSIKYMHKSLVYPEPPLYPEELSFLNILGIESKTPLSFNLESLKNKKIGISISEPSEQEMVAIGQGRNHLLQLSQDFGRHFLAREAVLVYGGDLRPDGFTKFLFEEAKVLKIRMQSKKIYIKNYIAWPIYNNDSADIKEWKSNYRKVASMVETTFPDDVRDLIPNGNKDSFVPPTNTENSFVWSRCLTKMRYEMIDDSDIRICAGGKHCDYNGKMPGVLEEILISIQKKCPIYLLGGFGGITASVCKAIINNKLPQELTTEWQINNSAKYKYLLEFSKERGFNYYDDYGSIIGSLKIENLNNGLDMNDNIRLFNTQFIDEALYLVFKGIKTLIEGRNTDGQN